MTPRVPRPALGWPLRIQKHISQPWFDHIVSGVKLVEGRPALGSFERVGPGSLVEFFNDEDVVLVRILAKRHYSGFREMLQREGLEYVLPGVLELEDGVQVYERFYPESPDGGVVALELEQIIQ